MGILDILNRFTGPQAPRLAETSSGAPRIELQRLQVHTAENAVILTICPATVEIIKEAIAEGSAVTFTNGDIDVHLFPVEEKTLTVMDPKRGWIIPLSAADRATICNTLSPVEDGYEVSENLAFIVEGALCPN